MTASNFKPSLALTLAHEGGFSNHPLDPGGATNQGITQRVYDAYRRFHGLKLQSVRYIAALEVSEIYQKNYWRLARADSLPSGLDYAVFDFAVNSGVSRAVRYLQRLVGVDDDGTIGMITLAAIEAAARKNEESLIVNYCAQRLAFVKSLATFATFGKGWTRRIVGLEPGVQINDKGVLDYAVFMARRNVTYAMPSPIGALAGEVAASSIAPLTNESFVEAKPTTYFELKGSIAEINDQLAAMIGAM